MDNSFKWLNCPENPLLLRSCIGCLQDLIALESLRRIAQGRWRDADLEPTHVGLAIGRRAPLLTLWIDVRSD